ncbi:OCA2 family protein [Megaselia abdita]
MRKLSLPNNELFSRRRNTVNEVTEGALEIWRNLPERIRHDPSLATFRQEHERIHGDETSPDDDPLPGNDLSASPFKNNNTTNNNVSSMTTVSSPVVSVDVTNEQVDHMPSTEDNTGNADENDATQDNKTTKIFHYVKIGILLCVWGLFTGFLMTTNEKVIDRKQIAIPAQMPKDFIIDDVPKENRIGIIMKGSFASSTEQTDNYLYVYVQLLYFGKQNNSQVTHTENITDVLELPLVDNHLLDTVKDSKISKTLTFRKVNVDNPPNSDLTYRIRFRTNVNKSIPITMSYDSSPIDKDRAVIYAAIVLIGLYIMIIWEVVNRTFAAIIASTMAIGILAALDERPPMSEIMGWIDVETLLLLFGMMILVAILSETGIFDYLAVYAYKITNGRVWPLINCLCFFTAIMSSFLDNVTTVLLMTPVSIRLCEVMGLNPVPILMCMIIYSNIGGALTPVGDPPNVIIASNSFISKNGVTFGVFTLHMLLGVIFVFIQTFIQIRLTFRNINDLRFNEPQEIQEMRHEIAVWQRAAASLSSYSKDEDIVRETLAKKVNRLKRNLKKKMTSTSVPIENYKQTLEDMQAKYPIRSKPLLIKSSIALTFVVGFFFLHSVPELQRLSLGWTALLGAILLLILADREDMESVLARVEWSTLLFFAALFILMESLSELGLIDWIGDRTESVILSVSEESRLAVAILIILWVSAVASAFVDNIPLTTMMIKIAISLAQNKALGLPLQPLVWALAFGACLGGNGTLIGASANVVCAGVAEQHGYRISFLQYFKVGFPIMIGNIVVATVYLMLAHVVLAWH